MKRISALTLCLLVIGASACSSESNSTLSTSTEDTGIIEFETTANENEFYEGDIISFGQYKWIVLEKTSDSAFIMTENCIEENAFGIGKGMNVWANCQLREYLNNEFINTFSDDERALIQSTELPDVGTTDKVFLLSREDAKKYFNSNVGEYSSEERKAYYGEYISELRKAHIGDGDKEMPCVWWLRTIGDYPYDERAAYVDEYGRVEDEFGGIDDRIGVYKGVRPAMWISLE